MKYMICETCGKHYDFDRFDTCPKCGAYNQPKRQAQPSGRVVTNTTLSRPRFSAPSSPDRTRTISGKKTTVWIIVVIFAVQIISAGIEHWDQLGGIFYDSVPEPPIVEDVIQDMQTTDAVPELELQSLISNHYKFTPVDGVQFILDDCGIVKNESPDDEENQYVYAEVAFRVNDMEKAENSDLTEPYIFAGGQYYYSVPTEELINLPSCNPIDFSPIGAGETDSVSGQMFFILPRDTQTFLFCWDSKDAGTQAFQVPDHGLEG